MTNKYLVTFPSLRVVPENYYDQFNAEPIDTHIRTIETMFPCVEEIMDKYECGKDEAKLILELKKNEFKHSAILGELQHIRDKKGKG